MATPPSPDQPMPAQQPNADQAHPSPGFSVQAQLQTYPGVLPHLLLKVFKMLKSFVDFLSNHDLFIEVSKQFFWVT